VITLLGLIYGKLVALSITAEVFGEYNTQFGFMTFIYAMLVSPSINAFKSALGNIKNESLTEFYTFILSSIYLGVVPLLLAIYLLFDVNINLLLLIWASGGLQCIYTMCNGILEINGKQKQAIYVVLIYNLILVSLMVCLHYQGYYIKVGTIWGILAFSLTVSSMLAVYYCNAFIKFDIKYSLNNIVIKWIEVIRGNLFKEEITHYINYIKPLLVLALFSWVNNYSDRFFIKYILNSYEVGIYSVGYSIGSKILILATPFVSYLSPIIYDKTISEIDRNKSIFKFVKIFLVSGIIAVTVLYFLRNIVGNILLSKDYTNSFIIFVVIALAHVMLGCVHILEMRFYALSKTKYVLFNNISGAITNVILNIILIPKYQILGAGLATLGSFFVQFLTVLFFYRKK
jgi:O-antigen/teichoic acid export membrane protein